MNITTKWILGSIGVILAIVGILLIVSAFASLRNKRNLARKIRAEKRIAGEKYDNVISSLRNNEEELWNLYDGKRALHYPDDSLHADIFSNNQLYEKNVELKLLENRFRLEHELFSYDFPKQLKYLDRESRWEVDKKRLNRAKQISILQSKISSLKVDVDNIQSSKSLGGSLESLDKDSLKLDRRSIGSIVSSHSDKSSLGSLGESTNQLKQGDEVDLENIPNKVMPRNRN